MRLSMGFQSRATCIQPEARSDWESSRVAQLSNVLARLTFSKPLSESLPNDIVRAVSF